MGLIVHSSYHKLKHIFSTSALHIKTALYSKLANMDCSDDTSVKVKVEPKVSEETKAFDLSHMKKNKKQHVKIEYEKDSPPKDSKGLWEPKNWREFLRNLRTMRAKGDAPVLASDPNASPKVFRYHSLISLMLSSQTKDQVTFAAMERLIARGVTVDVLLEMSDEELGKLIYPVAFWKKKVKYLKKTTQTLKDLYNGDIPDTVEKLCKLTGVGPKMAHICMMVAWNQITGIGVDTHVHRISNRIGWVKTPTKTPEDTRKALESWIPFELWSELNLLMVGFGQTVCLPIGPLCNECLNKDICPSRGLARKSPNKRTSVKIKYEIDVIKPENKLSIPSHNIKAETNKHEENCNVNTTGNTISVNLVKKEDNITEKCTDAPQNKKRKDVKVPVKRVSARMKVKITN